MHQHSVLARNISANVIGTILGTMFRFWSYRKWVFVEADDEEREEAAAKASIV
jgi:hypothetical protein